MRSVTLTLLLAPLLTLGQDPYSYSDNTYPTDDGWVDQEVDQPDQWAGQGELARLGQEETLSFGEWRRVGDRNQEVQQQKEAVNPFEIGVSGGFGIDLRPWLKIGAGVLAAALAVTLVWGVVKVVTKRDGLPPFVTDMLKQVPAEGRSLEGMSMMAMQAMEAIEKFQELQEEKRK